MIARYVIVAILAAAGFSIPSSAAAREMTLTRKEIREMPILERPSRPGHFYGNTVRRSAARKAQPMTPGALWSDYPTQ